MWYCTRVSQKTQCIIEICESLDYRSCTIRVFMEHIFGCPLVEEAIAIIAHNAKNKYVLEENWKIRKYYSMASSSGAKENV